MFGLINRYFKSEHKLLELFDNLQILCYPHEIEGLNNAKNKEVILMQLCLCIQKLNMLCAVTKILVLSQLIVLCLAGVPTQMAKWEMVQLVTLLFHLRSLNLALARLLGRQVLDCLALGPAHQSFSKLILFPCLRVQVYKIFLSS